MSDSISESVYQYAVMILGLFIHLLNSQYSKIILNIWCDFFLSCICETTNSLPTVRVHDIARTLFYRSPNVFSFYLISRVLNHLDDATLRPWGFRGILLKMAAKTYWH